MMETLLRLIPAFLAGGLLGLVFFGGLWLTIRSLPSSRMPGLLVMVSLIVRLTMVLAGFFWVMGGRWERLLSCLAGFLLARTMIVNRTRISVGGPSRPDGGPV